MSYRPKTYDVLQRSEMVSYCERMRCCYLKEPKDRVGVITDSTAMYIGKDVYSCTITGMDLIRVDEPPVGCKMVKEYNEILIWDELGGNI